MLILFTDTDTDTTPEIAKEYGYNLISMPYSVGGERNFPIWGFWSFWLSTLLCEIKKRYNT